MDMATVTLSEGGRVMVEATNRQLHEWAYRSGSSWPCSVLATLPEIRVEFDANGLLDIEHPGVDDLPADELNAWSSDILVQVLDREHPAWFVTVGQFLGTCQVGVE